MACAETLLFWLLWAGYAGFWLVQEGRLLAKTGLQLGFTAHAANLLPLLTALLPLCAGAWEHQRLKFHRKTPLDVREETRRRTRRIRWVSLGAMPALSFVGAVFLYLPHVEGDLQEQAALAELLKAPPVTGAFGDAFDGELDCRLMPDGTFRFQVTVVPTDGLSKRPVGTLKAAVAWRNGEEHSLSASRLVEQGREILPDLDLPLRQVSDLPQGTVPGAITLEFEFEGARIPQLRRRELSACIRTIQTRGNTVLGEERWGYAGGRYLLRLPPERVP